MYVHNEPIATASGRAVANGRDEGVPKLLFDDSPKAHGHGKILGGGMVGTHAGQMIGAIGLAIKLGADAVDIGKTIHPHPTLGESIGWRRRLRTVAALMSRQHANKPGQAR